MNNTNSKYDFTCHHHPPFGFIFLLPILITFLFVIHNHINWQFMVLMIIFFLFTLKAGHRNYRSRTKQYDPRNDLLNSNSLGQIATQLRNYCKNCGESLDQDARFCSSCGNKVL